MRTRDEGTAMSSRAKLSRRSARDLTGVAWMSISSGEVSFTIGGASERGVCVSAGRGMSASESSSS